LQTVIRDQATDPEEFNFHITRLVRQLSHAAISMLDFHTCSVMTPTQVPFHGLDLSSRISAVSIVRTGEIFETAIRSVLPDVPVGKIVIDQNDMAKQEYGPRLYYAKLPANLATDDSTVVLFDGVLATGGAVSMAVHVLKDHGVPEDKIIFCCIVAAPEGLHKLHRMFPRLRVVTSWVDDGLDKNGFCKPGMGYIGERYFGTQ
jgi:uracil phosphoribosyltransferase